MFSSRFVTAVAIEYFAVHSPISDHAVLFVLRILMSEYRIWIGINYMKRFSFLVVSAVIIYSCFLWSLGGNTHVLELLKGKTNMSKHIAGNRKKANHK